jgi:hypothetical protein
MVVSKEWATVRMLDPRRIEWILSRGTNAKDTGTITMGVLILSDRRSFWQTSGTSYRLHDHIFQAIDIEPCFEVSDAKILLPNE